jgi:NTP pyrophosphatase (non-canonical NTP hydrolase)
MTDDNTALNEPVETETTQATTPVEEQTADVEVKTEAPEAEGKKGYSARVQELANAKKAAEEKANSLEQKLADLTAQVGQDGTPPYTPPKEDIVKPGEELTAEELNTRLSEREQRIFQMQELRLQQERALNRINQEAADVVRKYDALNPDSDNFNPELSDWVTDTVTDIVKANPNTSVKKIVSGLMRPYQKEVTKEVAAQTENIAKQASESAIRPSNAKPVEKKFEDLTIEEMEAQLGFVEP